VDPAGEMLRAELVALDFLATRFRVDGVEIKPMPAGNEMKRLAEVGPQLVGVASFAGVVAGCLNAAAGQALVALEAADVVALQAMQGYGYPAEDVQRRFDVNAPGGVLLACEGKSLFHRRGHRPPQMICRIGSAPSTPTSF